MMTQKQKGYVGLGVMLALGVGTVLGSDPLYKAIDVMSTEKVNYTPGTYVGSAQGFAGEVVATVTVGASGVESVELAGAAETPDFGGAALEKLAPAFVESNSSKVDVVAGATISSNAAIEAVQQALDQAAGKIDIIEREAAPETEAETKAEKKDSPAGGNYKPGTYEGSAQGFGGEIKAKVVIGEGGIESVELTGDGETPGLGADALEKLAPAFAEAGSADVDIVAGSTVSSEAAIKAVQAALDQAAGGGEEKAPETQAPKAEAVSYVPGTYEGSAKGFGGDVTAKVVIGESGIESVELTGKDETPGLGADALEKLEGAFVEAGSADVDGVAGATISSDAAKKAVGAALEGAAGGAAEASAQAGGESSYAPGTYEGSAKGFGGDVTAKVVIGESGIESVELTGKDETPGLGADALEKLEGAFVEAGSADVDGVAGATISSDAAKKAVEAALEGAVDGAAEASAQAGGESSYKPGTYEGSAKGFGGDVTAKVVIGEGGIESVELTGKDETPGLGADALEKLEGAFVEAGSADVDGVSGSTVSSEAAMKAVQAALDQAK